MKSSSRDSPAARSPAKASSSTETASVGIGRRKNSDFAKRQTGSGENSPSADAGSSSPRFAQYRRVPSKDRRSAEDELGSTPALVTSSSRSPPAPLSPPSSAA